MDARPGGCVDAIPDMSTDDYLFRSAIDIYS